MAYNRYRKRHYNISKTKRIEYAQKMENLDEIFSKKHPDWILSSKKDSCYYRVGNVFIRISNHSIDNQYHPEIHTGEKLYLNIKASKLDFSDVISNKLPKVLDIVGKQDLSKYRVIIVVNDNIHFYYKGFKTKKETIRIL